MLNVAWWIIIALTAVMTLGILAVGVVDLARSCRWAWLSRTRTKLGLAVTSGAVFAGVLWWVTRR